MLPLGSFYKSNQRSDGLTSKCGTCIAAARKDYDRKYNASKKARAKGRRYYYSAKGQENKVAYRQRHPLTDEQKERYRTAGRAHEKEPKYKARRKRYDLSVKGKAMKARKDKKFAKTDKGRFVKHKVEIRRRRQLRAESCTLTRAQWLDIKAVFQNQCAYCRQTFQRLEMDHLIPLSRGGRHIAENIVPACRRCNASKGDRLLESAPAAPFGT